MSPQAHITGWGKYVPQHVLTNQDLAKMVDTTDEWIVSRTGIRERHIATDGENNVMMAAEAALQALEVANVRPMEVDLIICSTSSPDQLFPSTASLVQDRIGATKAGAFDLLAACSGFIFAMHTASQAIRSGANKCILVIGVETLSNLVDWNDRATCILFGDGAGAFVLQAQDGPGGLLSGIIRSDGSGKDLLYYNLNPRRFPLNQLEELSDKTTDIHPYIKMDGREVFRFAIRVLGQVTKEAVEKANLKLSDISLVIPHQANLRIIDAAMKYLNLPDEKFFVNVDRYGNTSTASIPIATCEAVEAGRIKPGDKIVFVGFGAGLTWGATVAEWTGAVLPKRKVHPAQYRTYARIRSFLLRILRRIDAWFWRSK
jgi:3-oxoacyl-[acyl-carrier-protein] synthase-3